MLLKGKKNFDKGKVFGALLTYLSKAFDCVSHELITAKLNSCGFSFNSLNLTKNYFSHRKQRTKINHSDNSWEEILLGVPQGSILDPILFNVFLSDLCLIIKDTDFGSYADNNTIYEGCNNADDVIAYLQRSFEKPFKWFWDNQIKGNTDKCHLSSNDSSEIKIGNS